MERRLHIASWARETASALPAWLAGAVVPYAAGLILRLETATRAMLLIFYAATFGIYRLLRLFDFPSYRQRDKLLDLPSPLLRMGVDGEVTAVLHDGPVDSPEAAVRAAIMADENVPEA